MADESAKAEQKDPMVDTLVLQLDRRTMTLAVRGDVFERIQKQEEVGFDIAFNMLGQATRQLDCTYRILNGMKAQMAFCQAQEEEKLRQSLMGRGPA